MLIFMCELRYVVQRPTALNQQRLSLMAGKPLKAERVRRTISAIWQAPVGIALGFIGGQVLAYILFSVAQAGYPVVSVLLLIALVLWETHRLMDRTPGQLVVLTRTTIATMFVTFVLSAIYAAQLIPYFARINIR